MAFNCRMHPRNIYKNKKPNFKDLASKYEKFKNDVTVDEKGKVNFNFKEPDHVRALTWALLKDDFGLDVTIPQDRLIPTVPLRLNYILWIEDLLAFKACTPLQGIDIGCGAACIYSLLGAKKNSWSFLATEVDCTSYEHALKNVQENNLSSFVKVVQVPLSSTLLDIIHETTDEFVYDFCLCNPPFFENNLDAWGITKSRSESRPKPKSINTACDLESIYPGGELEFVKKVIVQPSLKLKTKIKIYTTMFGKKSSVKALISHLRDNQIKNVVTTEFCQGNTMRWGVAWTFNNDLKLPEHHKQAVDAPPLVLELIDTKSSVQELKSVIENVLCDLKMRYSEDKTEKFQCEMISWSVSAQENTWIHQRRKRRRGKDTPEEEDAIEPAPKKMKVDDGNSSTIESVEADKCMSSCTEPEPSRDNEESDENYILKFNLNLTNKNSKKSLEFIWKDGSSKELLHQVLQFFKNHFEKLKNKVSEE